MGCCRPGSAGSHPRFNTPSAAIITYCVVCALLAISGTFKALAILAAASTLVMYLVTAHRGAGAPAPPGDRGQAALRHSRGSRRAGDCGVTILAVLSTLAWRELAAIGVMLAASSVPFVWRYARREDVQDVRSRSQWARARAVHPLAMQQHASGRLEHREIFRRVPLQQQQLRRRTDGDGAELRHAQQAPGLDRRQAQRFPVGESRRHELAQLIEHGRAGCRDVDARIGTRDESRPALLQRLREEPAILHHAPLCIRLPSGRRGSC